MRGNGRTQSLIAIATTTSLGRGASGTEIVTVPKSSNDQTLSLLENGISIAAPDPATLTLEQMTAFPPPIAARIGLPSLGCTRAWPCSSSPSAPTIAALE